MPKKTAAKSQSSSMGDNLLGEVISKESRPGRPPKRPRQLNDILQQVVRETESWTRKCREVWFPDSQIIDGAFGKVSEETIGLYDDAVDVFRYAAKCVKDGTAYLKKGKDAAKQRLAEKDRLPPVETDQQPIIDDNSGH